MHCYIDKIFVDNFKNPFMLVLFEKIGPLFVIRQKYYVLEFWYFLKGCIWFLRLKNRPLDIVVSNQVTGPIDPSSNFSLTRSLLLTTYGGVGGCISATAIVQLLAQQPGIAMLWVTPQVRAIHHLPPPPAFSHDPQVGVNLVHLPACSSYLFHAYWA
jgi:hypothetical protein